MFLARLKETTHTIHIQLEHDLDIFRTVTTLERYVCLLQKFLGFYLPLEPSLLDIQCHYNLPLDIQQRSKSPLLLNDLRHIGMPPSTVHPVSLCDALPELTIPAHLWGCMYVLEGSTLGGTLIAKHIKKELGLTAEHGCAFFSSYGSNVGAMWRTFISELETYARHYHEEKTIIDAACETFALLRQWILKE